MPVGVVADDAAAQPDDLAGGAVVGQILLDLGPAELRIAVRIEQALLGRQDRPGSVAVDRPPFENDAGRRIAGGRSARPRAAEPALSRSNGGYLPPQALYSQSTSAGGKPGGPGQKHRSVVASPNVVGRNLVQRDVRQVADERFGLSAQTLPRRRPGR